MPGSNKSFQSNSQASQHQNQTLLQNSLSDTLQKDVDQYTRKLEKIKRKLIDVEENNQIVKKDLKEREDKIIKLQKEITSTDYQKKICTIKNLQHKLDKAITTYNVTMAENKKLKAEIDVLRRERTTFKKIRTNMQDQFQKCQVESKKISDAIEKKKKKADNTQFAIYQLKQKHEEEQSNYLTQFELMQRQIKDDKKQKEKEKKTISKPKLLTEKENFEPQKILKRRLQKIILNNKEKVKVIEQYQRNMSRIDEAFNQIKEGSGITDIEEITNTFIKSEEQNYSLYNYVDQLTQEIDNLEEQNLELTEKIEIQKEANEIKRKIYTGTPDEEQYRKKIKQIMDEKEVFINQLQDTFNEISPQLQNLLVVLANSIIASEDADTQDKLAEYQQGIVLNDNNFAKYFCSIYFFLKIVLFRIIKQKAELEEYINNLIIFRIQSQGNEQHLSNVLLLEEISQKEFNKTKTQPQFITNMKEEDFKNKEQDGSFLNPQKLRDIAIENIEKSMSSIQQSQFYIQQKQK